MRPEKGELGIQVACESRRRHYRPRMMALAALAVLEQTFPVEVYDPAGGVEEVPSAPVIEPMPNRHARRRAAAQARRG